jgi:hypothetical protein
MKPFLSKKLFAVGSFLFVLGALTACGGGGTPASDGLTVTDNRSAERITRNNAAALVTQVLVSPSQ